MISKKILATLGVLITASFSSLAYADDISGFYIGGQAGFGSPDYGSDIKTFFKGFPNYSTKEGGLAGRVYAGYQFNPYLGLEAGYALFSNNNYEGNNGAGNGLKLAVKTQQADLLGKVGMPFGDSGFRGDIKAGAAYVRTSVDATVTASSSVADASASVSGSQNNWDPAAGASISYNFTPNFAVDVSYLHAFGSGDPTNPNTDLITLGVSYLFA